MATDNERRLALYSELGAVIGPIVERETSLDLARATDCVDCLLSHATEIINIYFNLSEKDSITCFKLMKSQVIEHIKKVQERKNDDRSLSVSSD